MLLDKRINRFVKLALPEVEVINKCRELMLQAVTYAREGKNVDSYFALAKVERDKFEEYTSAWNLCENAIQESAATNLLEGLQSGRIAIHEIL